MLLGLKITERSRHAHPAGGHRPAQRLPPPDWTGPDDLTIKIVELARSPTGRSRSTSRSALPARASTPRSRSRPAPTRSCSTACRAATADPGRLPRAGRHPDPAGGPPSGRGASGAGQHRKVQLIVSGGIRSGADVAKALAMGADAVSIGTAPLTRSTERAALPGGLRGARHPDRLLPPLPHRPLPGRHHDPGPGAGAAPRRRAGGAPGRNNLTHLVLEAQTLGPRLRQVASLEPRARGPRRADRRGRGDGRRAARRRQLDPRQEELRTEAGGGRQDGDGSAEVAKKEGIRYFLISFVDLFGVLRAKLVPAAAIGDMAKTGAGFAGFATWLDMTPADPDMFAIPDPRA